MGRMEARQGGHRRIIWHRPQAHWPAHVTFSARPRPMAAPMAKQHHDSGQRLANQIDVYDQHSFTVDGTFVVNLSIDSYLYLVRTSPAYSNGP